MRIEWVHGVELHFQAELNPPQLEHHPDLEHKLKLAPQLQPQPGLKSHPREPNSSRLCLQAARLPRIPSSAWRGN